jgi:DNA-binding response OmpR family regulator
VLVVDDEPQLRALLVDALQPQGVEILAAGSGREALDLARRHRPDLLIADYRLGDCTGLDVIDRVRAFAGDVPAVVITGYGDAATLTEASRRRPVELMTKPLNLERLRATVGAELGRQAARRRHHQRARRLRHLARTSNLERKAIRGKLETTCCELTTAYRALSGQLSQQEIVIGYQNDLIGAKDDDDVFRALFRVLIKRSGALFGVALVCDESAQLKIAGRFGVPKPDPLWFCGKLAWPVVDEILVRPRCLLLDAGEKPEMFDESVRRHLPGLTILAVPFIPDPGELIGLAVLYRKGEQPFTDRDVSLAEMIAYPTAAAVRRND